MYSYIVIRIFNFLSIGFGPDTAFASMIIIRILSERCKLNRIIRDLDSILINFRIGLGFEFMVPDKDFEI